MAAQYLTIDPRWRDLLSPDPFEPTPRSGGPTLPSGATPGHKAPVPDPVTGGSGAYTPPPVTATGAVGSGTTGSTILDNLRNGTTAIPGLMDGTPSIPAPGTSKALNVTVGGKAPPVKAKTAAPLDVTRSAVPQVHATAVQAPPPPPPPPVTSVAGPAAAPNYQALASLPAYAGTPQYQTAAGSFQGEQSLPGLQDFAAQWMANPNRYLAPAAQATLSAIQDASRADLASGERGLAELMAARGINGSSVEFTNDADLRAQLDRTRQQQYADLLNNQAAVEAADRAAAGGFGLGVGQFAQGLGEARRAEGQFAFGANRQTAQDAENARLNRANLGLQGASLADTSALNRYQAALAANQQQYNQGLQGAEFTNAADLARASLGLQNQDLTLRAYQIQQDAIQRGQAMDLQQAMEQAQRQLQYEQLALQQQQVNNDQGWRDLMGAIQAYQALNTGG